MTCERIVCVRSKYEDDFPIISANSDKKILQQTSDDVKL